MPQFIYFSAICKTGEPSCFKIQSKVNLRVFRDLMLSPVAYLLSFVLQGSELSTLVEIYIEIILVAKGLLSTEPDRKQ